MNNFENLKINDLSTETEEGYYKIVEQLEKQPLDLNKLPDDFRDSDPSFDPKLVDLLKENESIKIPSRLDESVMANYHQQIKLQNSFLGRTLFRNLFRNKQFIKRIAKSKGMKNAFIELIRINLIPTLRPVLVGALLFILSIIVYYQYTKPQNNPTNIMANQETPAIKASPTIDTPILVPSPIETIDPKFAKNPRNNEDNIKQESSNGNNKEENRRKEDDKVTDNINTGSKNIEPVEIAKNIPKSILRLPTERSELNSISSIEKVFVNKFSLDIHTQDTNKQLWLDKIHNGLIQKIPSLKGEEDWKVINNVGEAEVFLQFNEKENSISLVNFSSTNIWTINIKDYFMESPEAVIDKIIDKLQEDIITDLQKNNDKNPKN